MGLKAVPAAPDEPVDLTGFKVSGGPPPERRWRQVLAELSADDEAKLRAALLEEQIAPNAISLWFERRDIIVDPRTIRGWRRRRFATTA